MTNSPTSLSEGCAASASAVATKPYALYLGCTIPQRATNYEMSARKVAAALGVEFIDIPDMVCCGYPLASMDEVTPLTMSARILAQAEAAGADVCCLCSACTGSLTEADHELMHNPALKAKVDENLAAIGLKYTGGVKVRHFARILIEEVGVEAIAAKVVRTLPMRVAPHYGCHFLRPSEVFDGFDSVEDPKVLDILLGAVGCKAIDYPEKLKCCGGGVLAVDEKLALSITNRKLAQVKERNADAICLVCPFCNIMYDTNQKKIEQEFEANYQIPVLFLTQILGLAMGMDTKELGFQMNRVRTKELLAKLGI
jgi:heterodisulfide reductase subunit B2